MFSIILIVVFLGILFVLLKKNNKNKSKIYDFVKNYKENDPDKNIASPKSLLSTIASNAYAKKYLAYIDMQNNKIINIKKLRNKAICAGIRDSNAHLVLAGMMIILSVFLALSGFLTIGLFIENPTFMVRTLCAIGLGILGYNLPYIRLDSLAKDRAGSFIRAFSDMLDLVIVCIETGMSSDQAFLKMIDEFKESSPVLSEEIAILSAELTYFLDYAVAYENLTRRIPHENVRAFCSALVQSKKFGTPLVQSLKGLSKEIREAEVSAIERRAAALPAKLTVPMMLFTLPVLMVVILAPAGLALMEVK